MNTNTRTILKKGKPIFAVVLIIVAIVSCLFVSRYASSPSSYGRYTEKLDQKRDTVLTLTTGAVIAGNMTTMLPEDTASEFARTMTNVTTGLFAVQTAIFLEKYLMPISGLIVYRYLIPVMCAMLLLSMFVSGRIRKYAINIFVNIAILSIAFCNVTQISVNLAGIVESTCEESINNAVTLSEKFKNIMEDEADEDDADKSGIEAFIDGATGLFKGVTDGVTAIVESVQSFFGNLVESMVVFIVTTIIIPIITLFILVYVLKTFLQNLSKMMCGD